MTDVLKRTRIIREIKWTDIQPPEKQTINSGSYGIVKRAIWEGREVAVKIIMDNQKTSFDRELKQLSRIDHPNIVELFAVSRNPLCLVMEYAEGGSLYQVLHYEDELPDYTSGLAISWLYQCASGVEYLHNMKPKPLIHRDLKPPNLLLINQGLILKICDFGLSREKSAGMTANTGSGFWMAPEVFSCPVYNEKCDVFSFGIIAWEVLTRKHPMAENYREAVNQFRVMWDYSKNKRPKFIANCPPPIWNLMTKCWAKEPTDRPNMTEVVRILSILKTIFKDGNVPLKYPNSNTNSQSSLEITTPTADNHKTGFKELDNSNFIKISQVTISTESSILANTNSLASAPASLHSSLECLNVGENRVEQNVESNVLLSNSRRVTGHRRSGSHGQNFVVPPNQLPLESPTLFKPARSRHRKGEQGAQSPNDGNFASSASQYSSTGSLTPGMPIDITKDAAWLEAGISRNDVNRVNVMACKLDYQPLAPDLDCSTSVQIFQDHCQLAKEYMQMQIEIQFLTQKKFELDKELEQNLQIEQEGAKLHDNFKKQQEDRDSLANFLRKLQQEYNLLKHRQQPPFNV